MEGLQVSGGLILDIGLSQCACSIKDTIVAGVGEVSSHKLGNLRPDNGDVNENIVEKRTSHPLTFSRLCQVAQILKRRKFMLELTKERGPPPNSDKDARIYRLDVPVLK